MTDGRSEAELRATADSVPRWRHRIDLGRGVVTPGTEDCRAELGRLSMPSALDGLRVLDVGCSDGFYSFEAERRGASEVVAIDDESSLLAGGVNGFTVASDAIGSGVKYRSADVERLEVDDVGTFDLILFINVLYHLPNPQQGLAALARVARPGALLLLKTYFRSDVRLWLRGRCVGFDVDRRPKWWYFPGTELGGDPTNWWAPNRRGLEAMLGATGWGDLTLMGRHGDRLYYHARRS